MPGMMPAAPAPKAHVQVPAAAATLQRKPKREVASPRPTLNPMFNQTVIPQAHAPVPPAQPAPAHESGGYPQPPQVRPSNPGASGGWSRSDLGATDPREVPAFLRRRGEQDGGYVR